MPRFIQKSLMTPPKDKEKLMIFCTTNGTINMTRRTLVMGKGAALAMRAQVGGCDGVAALDILKKQQDGIATFLGTYGNLAIYEYHICRMGNWNNVILGGFQVKYYYGNKADLILIKESVVRLREIALRYNEWTLRVNFPGIGLGGLKQEEVKPLLLDLPDNVEVVS
jgi:hypothetical protein